MAGNDSSLDVTVLGLDGFRLRAATEDDGELLMLVETTASVVGCSGCGTRARSKGRRRTKVRDLPVGGRPTVLVWSKRVWRCPEAACDVGSWSETSPLIRPRAVLSERARRESARRVGEDGVSVAAVARGLGVGWSTVMDAVREFGEPLVEEQLGSLAGVRSLGMDEHRWRSRPDRWATGFVDLEWGRLLEVVQGRSGAAARGFLASETADVRVGVVALESVAWLSDPCEGAAARSDRDRGPFPHGPACEPGRHRSPPTYPPRRVRPSGPQGRSALRHPPATARRRRTAQRIRPPSHRHRSGASGRGPLRRGRLRLGSQRTPPPGLLGRGSRNRWPAAGSIPRLGRDS